MLHLPTRHIPSLVWPSPWLTSGLRKYNKPFSLTFKAYRIDERNLIVHAVSCKQSKHRAPPFLPLPQRLRLQTSSSSQILGDLNRQTCTNSEVPKSVWNILKPIFSWLVFYLSNTRLPCLLGCPAWWSHILKPILQRLIGRRIQPHPKMLPNSDPLAMSL